MRIPRRELQITKREYNKHMEQKEKHFHCGFAMCGEGHNWCHAIKVLVWLAIFVAIFALGLIAGTVRTARYYGLGGMMGWRSNAIGDYGSGTRSLGRSWMMGGYGDDAKGSQKVFGVITHIEGTKITILDNGGNTAVVLSASDTTILAGETEISLRGLVTGQDVSVLGTTDANGEVHARYIYVQGL